MENEKKVRSIRTDDMTFEKFKALCDDLGGQSECLSSLITAYELNCSKEAMPEQSTNISDFQAHADSMVRSYVTLLELTQNTEQRIRQEFILQLDSKDKTIIELQRKVEDAKNQCKDKQASAEETENKYNAAMSQYADLKAQYDDLTQKAEKQEHNHEELIDSLKEQLEFTKKEAAHNKAAAENNEQLTAQLSDQQQTIAGYKEQIAELQKQNEQLSQEKEMSIKTAQIELRAAVLEVKEECQTKIEKAAEEHTAKLDEYIRRIEQLQSNNQEK